jgi:hypothetical protein
VSEHRLGAYLNDHLAGSVGAVTMVERAIAENDGTPLAAALAALAADIREDQDTLRGLIARLGVSENSVKKAGAWVMERAARLKLADLAEDTLDRLEMLEALALGIHGKLALWRALEHAAAGHPAVAAMDLQGLARRAEAQAEQVEALRLAAAAEAF